VTLARIFGIDPGLRHTGWGVVDVAGNRLTHVANGRVSTDDKLSTAERLVQILDGLAKVIAEWTPDEAAIEETFVNQNPASTLKLGQARGAAMLAPAKAGLPLAEYAANAIKKAVVGAGHADKAQMQMMVGRLLPGVTFAGPDAADALAVAICHAHHAQSRAAWARGKVMAGAAP
jgi:crossover junction endodeoxyribonuclease RuvC